MTETVPRSPELLRQLSEKELMQLGSKCLEAAARTDLDSVTAAHEALHANPNSTGSVLLVGAGEVPMSSENVYRQVGAEAIEDLASSGIVRNGATAAGVEHRRWGHRVFWNNGEDGKMIGTGGRFVLEASKSDAEKGWITANKITGIHTKMPDGSTKNILELH